MEKLSWDKFNNVLTIKFLNKKYSISLIRKVEFFLINEKWSFFSAEFRQTLKKCALGKTMLKRSLLYSDGYRNNI